MSESYLERFNIIPYTPYSSVHKRQYQDTMGAFNIISRESIEDAYAYFTSFILDHYQENVEDLIVSLKMLDQIM